MRLIAVALLAGTSLALGACGGGADEADEPEYAASPEASPMASESPADEASPSPSAGASASPTPSPSATAKPAAGGMAAAAPMAAPAAFNQCKACHSTERGDHGIGPSLAGVYGTKAGVIPGFDFSDAMKKSGLTWNAANLDRYLENPQAVVPGNAMSFAGLKDAAKRKAVIDYLKSL